MKMLIRNGTQVLAVLGAGLLATVFATQANAGCSVTDANNPAPGYLQQQQWMQDQALRAASDSKSQVDSNGKFLRGSIVGLWKFTLVSKNNTGIPDGTVLDAGFATWHGDGTELINSMRPPITGDFCMGVWKQTAAASFKLNHIALAWDPTGTVFIGPANLREYVTLARNGNSFSGSFTIDQFAVDGTTVLAHLAGTVSGTRITAD